MKRCRTFSQDKFLKKKREKLTNSGMPERSKSDLLRARCEHEEYKLFLISSILEQSSVAASIA
jgi:hypothetical protein